MKWITITLFGVGGVLCCLNFYLSFLRYPIHRLMGKKKEEYKWVSGIPMFGSLFVILSLVYFWQTPWILALSILLILIDTGGLHWFAGVMIYQILKKKDKSFNQQVER